MENDERSIWDLDPEEQDKLKAVKTVDDIQDARFLRTWMKDGLPSVAMSINGIEMAFSDLDTDEAASLMNPQFTDAKNTLLKQLRIRVLLLQSEGELDDEDEFEAEDVYDDSAGSGGGDYYGNY